MKIQAIITGYMMIISQITGAAEIPAQGRFVYGIGNTVSSYDLATKKVQLLYEFPYGQLVSSFSILDADRILLVSGSMPPEIIELNLTTNKHKKLLKGFEPIYVPEHEIVFFYDVPKGEKEVRLYTVSLSDPIGSLHEVDKGPYVYLEQVVQVSKDEVVFLSGKDDVSQHLWKYNIVTKQMNRLPIEKCLPRIWRTATSELMCLDLSNERMYFTDLAGVVGNDFKVRSIHPTLYLPGLDMLVGVTARVEWLMSEVYDMWVYDFKEGKTLRVLKGGAAIGWGSMVWFQE